MAITNITRSKMYSKEIEAQSVKVGDFRVWNGGSFSKVVKVEFSKTGKTLEITSLYYKEMAEYNGEKWIGYWELDTRKCRATQKINIVDEESVLIAEECSKVYIEKYNSISSKNKNINNEIVNIEDIKELEPVAEVQEVEEIENIEELEVETMTKNDVLKMVNGSIHNIEMAKESLYRGKVYVVADSSIDNCFKTRKGAEGYIKKQRYISWYDEYAMEMVNAGAGLEVFEILESEITDIKTDYALWYRELRNAMRHSYAWEVVEDYAKKYLVSGELFAYVMEQIELLKVDECVQCPEGYTLSEEDNKQLVKIAVEPVQEIKEEIKEVETTEPTTEAAEQQESTLEVNYIVEGSTHTKTLETIYLVKLDRKVNKEEFKTINDYIKSLGGYWSRYTKTFIITDKKTAYSLVTPVVEKIENNTTVEAVETPATVKAEVIEVKETINIEDIDTYTVPEEISKRENNNSMFRSKDRDHNKEIQSILQNWNNELVAALEGNTDNYLEYTAKRKLQSLKKKYHTLYVRMITFKANNPSWAVTGRGGLNVNRYNKKASQYDKMIGQSVELEKEFNQLVNATDWKVKQQLNRQSKAQFEELKKSINTNSIKFSRTKDDNINGFKLDYTVTIYQYDNYYILSNYWGKFRVYKGNEEVGKFNSLNDAKVFVIADIQKAA